MALLLRQWDFVRPSVSWTQACAFRPLPVIIFTFRWRHGSLLLQFPSSLSCWRLCSSPAAVARLCFSARLPLCKFITCCLRWTAARFSVPSASSEDVWKLLNFCNSASNCAWNCVTVSFAKLFCQAGPSVLLTQMLALLWMAMMSNLADLNAASGLQLSYCVRCAVR